MQATSVTRILVWSRGLRLAHWSLALSSIGLLITGWLMNNTNAVATTTTEIHYMLSALLMPALILRLYLLFFGKGTDHLSACEPDLHRLSQAWLVLKFYLTLGKAPLPKWYSHNPFWGPLYLALFFVLALSIFSGFMMLNDVNLIGNLSLHALHHLCYQVLGIFTLLHILSVFSHDLGGSGSDISAMINGQRIFEVEQSSRYHASNGHSVEIDDLLKTLKR
ncbi:MAG: cytochrome b/b6 domain-containing protein [Candidatus Thiodiazotropha sp. (ex. Lucinoma kazani)]